MTPNFDQDNSGPNRHKHSVRFWRPIFSGSPIIIGFALTCWMLITSNGAFGEKIFILIFVLYFGGLLSYILNRYLACYNQIIEISWSDDTFYFGDNLDNLRLNKYEKDKVQQVLIYQPGGLRKVHFFYVFQITFKDGSIIKFSNMLISEAEIINAFSDDLIRYGNKSPFWRL
jgi:hypothetical protein